MERVRAERQRQREAERADRQKLAEELRASNQKLMAEQQAKQQELQEKLQQLLTPEQRQKLEQLRGARPQGRGLLAPRARRGLVQPDSVS
jgi:DNA-binding TFAR19-related protein (PDSD5 family)